MADTDHTGADGALADGTGTQARHWGHLPLAGDGFDPDDVVQQRSRTIMGNGWVCIAGQLGEVLLG